MSIGYQLRDYEVVDYGLWSWTTRKRSFIFRGPKPILRPKDFICCIGGAFTFGCFCEQPWPTLLGNALGMQMLNMGQAGVGPKWFNRPEQDDLIELVNSSALAIVMVMSGRSDENTLFSNEQGTEVLKRKDSGETLFANAAWNMLLEEFDNAKVLRLVEETRANYVSNFISYLHKLTVPKILFWFSERNPMYNEQFSRFSELSGGFPELVNQSMIDMLLPSVDGYVECVTSKGKPHFLRNRFTGRDALVNHDFTSIFNALPSRNTPNQLYGRDARSVNEHYPSPDMHLDAALHLEPVCRRLLSLHPRTQ
jgi:hypothetical protein